VKHIILAAAILGAVAAPAFAAAEADMTCAQFTAMDSSGQMAAIHAAMEAGAMASDHMDTDKMASDKMDTDHMGSGGMATDKMGTDAMSVDSMTAQAVDMCKATPGTTLGAVLKKLF